MCGCGGNMTVEQVINSSDLRDEICQKLKIDKVKFKAGDIYEISKFAYIVNPLGFKNQLAKAGLTVNSDKIDEELLALAELHKTSSDIAGLLKDDNGKSIVFSYKDILKGLPLNKKSIDQTKFCFI